jgi:hypothetical protein
VTATARAGTTNGMTAAEIAFACLSSIWCALAWLYGDPPDIARVNIFRRIAAGLCILVPLAACVLISAGIATVAALAVLAATFVWYLRLSPHNDHEWEVEYRRVPEIAWDGNRVHVKNIRDFRYPSRTDPIPAYYDAAYDIDTLTGVDLICSYWTGPAIAHVFLSFGFADGRHLAVSVETRRRRKQVYSSIAGFFRHYQLIYVVADERDLIGVRTDIRRERVYLYPLRITPEETRRLFGGYMNRAAALGAQPEFYNTLTNNCTSNIVRIIDRGYADAFAYDAARLHGRLPFDELKARSLIVRPADSMIGEDFSAAVRQAQLEES